MEMKKRSGFSKFFGRYGFYAIAGALVVAVGLTLALTLPTTSNLDPDDEIPTGVTPITWTLPMQGASIGLNYSATEIDWNQSLGEWAAHLAVDFIAGESDLVFAVADGTVASIETTYSDGTIIIIEHKDGYKSVYKSLGNAPKVKIGDKVTKGQEIGAASDSAGDEVLEGKHLHLELYKDGQKVDPNNYLDLEEK